MPSLGWLVVDLDGTIVDIRPRHYATHLRVTAALALPPVAPSAYWRIKRAGRRIPAQDIPAQDNPTGHGYDREFLRTIEAVDLLELDSPFPGAVEWLTTARTSGFRVAIATRRRNHPRTRLQVKRLAIPNDVLVTASDSKAAAVAAVVPSLPAAWIGDTEEDIDAARALGVLAVAVTSGIRSRSVLLRCKPDVMVASLHDVRLPHFG
jgi:phosphoglycolate phosphatase-like HAD superfamily hydrolase